MLTQLEQRMLETIRTHIKEHNVSPTIAEIASELNMNSRGTVHRYVQSLIDKKLLVREGTGWRGLRLVNKATDCSLNKLVGSGFLKSDPQNNKTRSIDGDLSRPKLSQLNLTDLNQKRDKPSQYISYDTSATDGDSSLPVPLPVRLHVQLLGRIAAGLPIEAIPDESHLDLAAFFIGPDRYALRVSGDSMVDAGIMDGDTVILRNQNTARSGDIVVALIDEQEATLKRLGIYNNSVVELIPENSTMAPMRYSAARVAIQGVLIGQLRSY